jgi:tRNA nucleotidyltransferase/poly(A) polymerase
MDTITIINRLCDCGFDAYITGGAVRDVLAGLPMKDEDIVTNATPSQLKELFTDCKVEEVGKSFGVTLIDGIEVAPYRIDKYQGLNDKACEVKFVETLEEDLARRDFTINSMAWCQFTGEVIDPFGGREDLKKKIIRFVGNPKDRIYEDPNRIIRACRFLAKLDGAFHCETFNVLQEHAHYVRDHVAKERIRLEILKAMELPNPSKFFQALFEIGVLDYIFPSMVLCADHHHGKYHREDIFIHLMVCGDNINSKHPLLRLAGYLHDIGKPISYSPDGKFIRHEMEGSEIVREELRALRFSTDEIIYITNLIKYHMLSIKDPKPKTVRRILAKFQKDNVDWKDFLRLRIADRKANLAKEDLDLKEIDDIYKLFHDTINTETPFMVKDLIVSGHDIMGVLNIPQGPRVGSILRALHQFVIDKGPEFNKKELLLDMIKEWRGDEGDH